MQARGHQQDRDLWEAHRRHTRSRHAERPDAEALAAYLEGRAGTKQRQQVERWLSRRPEAVSELRALGAMREKPLPEVPATIVERAKALVPEPEPGAIVHRLPFARRGLSWAAAATLALLLGAAGFELGTGTARDLARAERMLAKEIAFGIAPEDW